MTIATPISPGLYPPLFSLTLSDAGQSWWCPSLGSIPPPSASQLMITWADPRYAAPACPSPAVPTAFLPRGLFLAASLQPADHCPVFNTDSSHYYQAACFLKIYGDEIHITQNKPLKANNSVAFRKLTTWCNHHLCPVLKHFHCPKESPVLIKEFGPLSSLLPAPGDPQSVFCLCRFTPSGYFI